MSNLTVVSLFSGIGGIDLAFSWAGFEIIGQVEIDPFCRRVLSTHWPDVPRWGDVRTLSNRTGKGWNRYTRIPATCDVLAGGFPCQDISLAGQLKGLKEGTRSGLWFEFARLIGELRPRCVFLENVRNILNEGGTTVVGDLAELGYDVEWGIVPAAATGTPHIRERWWAVAYPNGNRQNGRPFPQQIGASHSEWDTAQNRRNGDTESDRLALHGGVVGADQEYLSNVGNTHCERLQEYIPATLPTEERLPAKRYDTSIRGERGLSKPRVGGVFNGLSFGVDRNHRWPAPQGAFQYDWEASRVIPEKVPYHNARVKALGNAVVPQVVLPIARRIYEDLS